jgi:hypothetical protein
MGLLERLPSPETISGTLSGITGDGTAGTGIAGVLSLLQGLDLPGLSGSLTESLDGSVQASASFDSGAMNSNLSMQFEGAMGALPTDGSGFVAPVEEIIARIKALAAGELSGQLSNPAGAMKALESIVPADTGSLVEGVADKLKSIKGELIGGSFGDVLKWSDSVTGFLGEMRPVVEAGPDGLEERLIAFLAGKAGDVVKIALPDMGPVAADIGGLFDAALPAARIDDIHGLTADLTAAFGRVRNEFELGNFSNTLHLDQAEALSTKLAETLAGVVDALTAVLGRAGATAQSLSGALEQRLKALEDVEIVDIGDIRSKLAEAVGKVEKIVGEVDLEIVRRKMDELFTKLDGALKTVDLGAITAKIDELQARLEGALDSVDGALMQVASTLRNAFASIKSALAGLLSSLGEFQPDNSFRFHVQAQIEGFLDGLKKTLHETVQPAIETFRTTVGGTLGSVRDLLQTVSGEIDGVREQLRSALQGVADELDSADVPGTLEQIRAKFDGMLSQLGEVDFSIVADPVIAEIGEMRDALASIDVSSLNEVVLGSLKVSVEVVISLDFTGDITASLMAEFDKLLEVPRNGLREVEGRVEGALAQFGAMAPEALLAPLKEVFSPVSELLEQLRLETLVAPLEEWRDRARSELDKVSPTALLQPLSGLHADLISAFDKVSVETLIEPLETTLASLRTQIDDLNFDGLTAGMEEAFASMKKALVGLAPERLIDPLVSVFDMLMGVLDRFDPASLLKPLNDVFMMLAAPLTRIEARHIELMRAAFAPLLGLSASVDPRIAYSLVGAKAQSVAGQLDQVNIGRMLSGLKGGFDPMQASFKAKAGSSEVDLGVRVDGLNPLRNEALSKAIAGLQKAQADLKAAFPSAEPPAELVARYEAMQERLDSLVPIWLKRLSTPEDLRRAVEAANPLNIGAEINQLWEAVKAKLRNFDPRLLQAHITATFQTLLAPLDAFDPAQLKARIQQVIGHLTAKLDLLDLQMIVEETADVIGDIRAMLAALDPKPLIDRLEAMMDEVRAVLDAIDPVALLADLAEPVEAVLASIRAFDPATLLEPLQDIFERIQGLIAQIDLGVVLQPLNDRLTQLRDDLEENLHRTETAFKGMVAAIPLQAAA